MNKAMSFFSVLVLISFSSHAMMKSALELVRKKTYNVRHLSVQHCNHREGSILGITLKISTGLLGVCVLAEHENKKTQQLERLDGKITMLMQDIAALKNEKK